MRVSSVGVLTGKHGGSRAARTRACVPCVLANMLLAATLLGAPVALADVGGAVDPAGIDTPALDARTYEAWIGAEGTRRYASIWTGLTWAPFGDVRIPGLRLRAVTGGGRYSYDGWRIVNGLPAPSGFKGLTAFADALVGYHVQIGALTLKPFAGIAVSEHWITPLDPVSRIAGRSIGAKIALETWLNVGTSAWLNVDGSWSQVSETTSLRARAGYRLFDDVSVGFEASALSDITQEWRRTGVFLRYAWDRGEISVNAGFGGRTWEDTTRSAQPYAGITALGRF